VKITNARLSICSPGRNFVTLILETDEGIVGLGDGTLNGREMAVASYLSEHILPCIIGRDPFQTEDIWQYLYRGAYSNCRSGHGIVGHQGKSSKHSGLQPARR
jgi:mannonate dehydratase